MGQSIYVNRENIGFQLGGCFNHWYMENGDFLEESCTFEIEKNDFPFLKKCIDVQMEKLLNKLFSGYIGELNEYKDAKYTFEQSYLIYESYLMLKELMRKNDILIIEVNK